jgi:Icc-related predicted phosphoesterase
VTVRVAAVGDVHVGTDTHGRLRRCYAELRSCADVFLIAGDLTRVGTEEEAACVVDELADVGVPVIAVLGNHDHDADQTAAVIARLGRAGVCVLEGASTVVEVNGTTVGIAGVKGFGGGFGPRALAPWGEETIKRFVHEAVDEALKLEGALARLRTPQRIAVLHYSPIQATVEGEPLEIFPFLGSSRLEEPLNRYPVTAIFHGHAHKGALEGRTKGDVPVYNVAMPLLARSFPGRPPVRIVEVQVSEEGERAAA